MHRSLALFVVTLLVASPAIGSGSQIGAELRPGVVEAARLEENTPAVFSWIAPGAGVLTVFVDTDEADLTLEVTDPFGTRLEEGMADSDRFGSVGTEVLSVILRRAGEYRVIVSSYSNGAEFEIGASWLPVEALTLPDDPDGRPDVALDLPVGGPVVGEIDPAAGDTVDWFVITAEVDGIYTLVAEGDDDIYLEYFVEGEFAEPADRADQDEGAPGNETLPIRLRAGQRAWVKVGSPIGAAAGYSLRLGRT